jgi:predicted TIM-barrel fold metal-dependent hydrolase
VAYLDPDLAGKPILFFDDDGRFLDAEFPGRPPQVPGTTPSPAKGTTGWNYEGISNIDVRLRDYERMGIDLQVLVPQFTPVSWSYLMEPRLATSIAHSNNLAVLHLMQEHPKAFIGAALVAAQDVDASLREIDWAYANDFRAVIMETIVPVPEHPFGETLGEHRELWPIFQRAEELDLPILLHNTQHGHRSANIPRFWRIGLDIFAPQDSHMNLVSLITGGLLDDFPKLKVIHTETGTAWIKPLVERLDSIFVRAPINYDEENPNLTSRRRIPTRAPKLVPPELASERNKLAPSHYFRTNLYFTIETEEPELPDAVEFLGADHFLFATDYPHDDPGGRMKFSDVHLLRSNPRISEPDKELIFWQNAAALFKIDQGAEETC